MNLLHDGRPLLRVPPVVLRTAVVLLLGLTLTAAQESSARAQIPTPESVLGFRVGQDFHLASYDESLNYFRKLAQSSDRIRLEEVGRTTKGLPWYLALISSPENLANVEHYREIAQRLANPEGLSDAEARRLAEGGKAIVHIDGGLHSTEVAHGQHTIQLAYNLVSSNDPEIQEILDNVILILWFSINPDGQNMVVDWYRSNLGTPYEVAPMVRLYQKYIGHDNNRDGYMINMIESRVITRVTRHWEPQVLYNHHQTAPFPARIWIPPFAEPISEFAHPLMWRTVNLIGMRMAYALEERNQPGAMHMGNNFDNWYPGFMDHANNFHNVAAFLTETGLYRYATPHFYTVDDFPKRAKDLRPESLYPSPWKGGWWRLGDAVDYMLTASMSVLDVASKYRENLLYDRYQAARDVAAQYRKSPPYAYFISPEQRDPVAPVELLRRLAFNGIAVQRLQKDIRFEGVEHSAGTWVILMDQPNANFVRQLFALQNYPDLREYPEGPPEQPYDVAGWTLPYQMGVQVVEADSPLTDNVRAALQPVQGEPLAWDADVEDASPFDSAPGVGFDSNSVARAIRPVEGTVSGSGDALILDPAQNNSFRALNRAWRAGAAVHYQVRMTETGADSERWVVTGLSSSGQKSLVQELALQAEAGAASGSEVEKPRIGLYRSWDPSIDEGWTRWLLERYDFEFSSLYNVNIVAGDLNDRYDVIILADMSPEQIVKGHEKGIVPARYAGGLAGPGVRALAAFVDNGGTLVAINGSSRFAIDELHLPVKDVTADLERSDFFLSGSIVEMEVDPAHPVMAGMPRKSRIDVSRSPVFTTLDGFRGHILAKYAEKGSPLLSGYLLGEKYLQGYAAAVDAKQGRGHVVLLGLKPQWRGQPFGNFRILFNAALYSRQVAELFSGNPGFWSPPKAKEEKEEKPQSE